MKSDDLEVEFEDDRPVRNGSNGIALAALILGLCSLLFTIVTGIPAIICGAIGLARAKQANAGFASSMAGLILGIVGCTICPIFILIGLLLPAVQKVREAASRAADSNHFKEVALDAYNYESKMNALPPPFYKDLQQENENLSWRVALLNYADVSKKYDHTFDYTKAWDAPVNRRQSNQSIEFYVSKLDPQGTTDTRIQGFVGKGTMFDPSVRGGVPFTSVSDGTSNTILFAESRNLVPWAAPSDMPYSANAPVPALGHPTRPQGFIVCMVDGSVKFVRHSANPEILRGYITRNDGQVLPTLE